MASLRVRALALLFTLLVILLGGETVRSEMSSDEHASHHGGGESGGEGEHEGAGTRDTALYPSLMRLDHLSPEKRAKIDARANRTIESTLGEIGRETGLLGEASRSDDLAAMRVSTQVLREALARLQSALAAKRILSEPEQPQKTAMSWFKSQMGLAADRPDERAGLGVFHWAVMMLLAAFAAATVSLRFVKMRRAAALVEKLIAGEAVVALAQTGSGGQGGGAAPAPGGMPADTRRNDPGTPPISAGTTLGKWSGQLRIARIVSETPNVKTLRLINADGGPLPFQSLPGQFLIATITLDGKPIRRSYTIASSPTQRRYCEITVKHEDLGVVSTYLHEQLQPGVLVDASAPFGKFTFTGKESPSIVLIGGGVGITPLMSILRYLDDTNFDGEIFLLQCARTPSDMIFRRELEALAARNPSLHVVQIVSRPGSEPWTGRTGRLSVDLIASVVPRIATRRIHLCGPTAMMTSVRAMLVELGIPLAQVVTEAFGPEIRPAERGAAEAGCGCDRCRRYRAEQEPSPAAIGPASLASERPAEMAISTATVSFVRSQKSAPLPAERSVLDVADSIGVAIDSSCRVGVCGLCKVELLSGHVTMEYEEGLDPADKARGFVLACQAKSTADVAIGA